MDQLTFVTLLATVKRKFSRVSCFLHGATSHESAYTPESSKIGLRAAKPGVRCLRITRKGEALSGHIDIVKASRDAPKMIPARVKLMISAVRVARVNPPK